MGIVDYFSIERKGEWTLTIFCHFGNNGEAGQCAKAGLFLGCSAKQRVELELNIL